MKPKIKIMFAVFICAFIVFSVFFVAGQYQTHPGNDRDTLFQLAAFNTFSMGNYTGTMSYTDLGAHGDFGIGTFDGLDGEMIALGNVFYQIPSSGVPREAQPTQTAPYATITYFEADQIFSVSNLTYTELRTYLGRQVDVQKRYLRHKSHWCLPNSSDPFTRKTNPTLPKHYIGPNNPAPLQLNRRISDRRGLLVPRQHGWR